jgi:sterol desaturase/sphingolipid hydroxylase (fatty acid hydroxylase superfamily)
MRSDGELDEMNAPVSAIPSNDPERRSRTLVECARVFARRPSPWLIAVAVAAAVAIRWTIGNPSWRDVAMLGVVIASAPFIEWLIHVYILHARPIRVAGRAFDVPNAREHRLHHAEPADLAWVMIPLHVVPLFLAMLLVIAAALSWPMQALLGGHWLALGATAAVASFAFVGAYEWSHFLMHSPYRPRSRAFRAIWRNHRLHHYKNEHYWFGVTSTIGDRALRTAPDQRHVAKSETARRLHPEH